MNLPIKELQLNRMQMIRAWRSATEDICIAGRGTGKTRYKAFRFRKIVESTQGSCNAIYSKTFKSLLTNTISPILEGLQSFGYHRDIHYVIGEKPPKDWPLSPSSPARFDYYISFRNGTGFRIMSEDREDSFRGPSVDSVDGDEALMWNRMKFENGPIMANRGNDHKYGHVKIHHGVTIDTSMPISPQSQWIFEFGNYYNEDAKNGKDIWKLWNQVTDLQYEFLENSDPKQQAELVKQWINLRDQIVFYPKEIEIIVNRKPKKITRMFSFFNAFDNLGAVGLNYLQSAKRIMTPATFRTEMLNQRRLNNEDRFYNLNDEVHLYSAVNYSHLEKIGLYNFNAWKNETSEHDSDVDPSRPLDIAIDYGHAINGMRVGQPHTTDIKTGQKRLQYRFLKTLYVKPPFGITQLIDKLCTYYAPHKRKHIRIFYDHTAVGGENWRLPHIDDTVKALQSHGWTVERVYIGKAPDQVVKHQLWYKLLSEVDPGLPNVRFNAENDKEGYQSMQLAGVKNKQGGYGKDKDSERSKTIPREQATDLSDAGDLLILGNYKNLSVGRSEYIGL